MFYQKTNAPDATVHDFFFAPSCPRQLVSHPSNVSVLHELFDQIVGNTTGPVSAQRLYVFYATTAFHLLWVVVCCIATLPKVTCCARRNFYDKSHTMRGFHLALRVVVILEVAHVVEMTIRYMVPDDVTAVLFTGPSLSYMLLRYVMVADAVATCVQLTYLWLLHMQLLQVLRLKSNKLHGKRSLLYRHPSLKDVLIYYNIIAICTAIPAVFIYKSDMASLTISSHDPDVPSQLVLLLPTVHRFKYGEGVNILTITGRIVLYTLALCFQIVTFTIYRMQILQQREAHQVQLGLTRDHAIALYIKSVVRYVCVLYMCITLAACGNIIFSICWCTYRYVKLTEDFIWIVLRIFLYSQMYSIYQKMSMRNG